MKMILLAAAGAIALGATAQAAPASRSNTVAGPHRPIPYSQLNSY